MKQNSITLNKKHQQGFSIIEILVAMVIGLFLMAGVFEVFISSKESQENINDQVELVDESRIALEMMAHDVKRAGLWGKTNFSDSLLNNITSFNTVKNKIAAANDCVNSLGNSNVQGQDPGWALDVFRVIYGVSEETITTTGFPYSGCISGAYLTGDTIEIRYAGEKVAAANLDSSTVYIVSQGQFSDVFYGSTAPAQPAGAIDLGYGVTANDPPVTYHRYEAVLYYVSKWTDGDAADNDGIPSLRRVSIQSGPELVDDVVLSGVENLQVQFGVDLDNDSSTQSVQQYLDPGSIVVNADTNQWTKVRSVQTWMVVKSKKNRAENVAQVFTIPAIPAGTYSPAADGYKRLMVTTTNKLRNIEYVDAN